jgi:hypothetical protein
MKLLKSLLLHPPKEIYLFILFCGLFLLFPKFTNGQSWDNIPTALLPLSIINEHNFDFNEFEQGKIKLDKSEISESIYYFSINSDQKVVANYPIFPGLLMVPFYFLYGLVNPSIYETTTFFDNNLWNLVSNISIIVSSVTTIVLYKLSMEKLKNHKKSLVICMIFMFATPVISTTSRFIWQHTFSLLFLFLTLYFYEIKTNSLMFLTAVLAFLVRPMTIILTLPLIVSAFLFDKYLFSSKKYKIIDCVLFACSIILVLFQLLYSVLYLDGNNMFAIQYALNRFNGNLFAGLLGLLFSPARGMLFFSPYLIFSFYYFYKKRFENLEYVSGLILYILILSKWDMWYGGWSDSYRLLIEILPILFIGLIKFTKDYFDILKKYFVLILVVVFFSVIFHSVFFANYGDCGFNGHPQNIDLLNRKAFNERIWLDSPILRCIF